MKDYPYYYSKKHSSKNVPQKILKGSLRSPVVLLETQFHTGCHIGPALIPQKEQTKEPYTVLNRFFLTIKTIYLLKKGFLRVLRVF